jgi:hypothetical protein
MTTKILFERLKQHPLFSNRHAIEEKFYCKCWTTVLVITTAMAATTPIMAGDASLVKSVVNRTNVYAVYRREIRREDHWFQPVDESS